MKKYAIVTVTEDYSNIKIFSAPSWSKAVDYFKEKGDEDSHLVTLNSEGEGTIYIGYEVDGPKGSMSWEEIHEDDE